VLRRLAGDRESTEVPVGGFDTVTPAAPVDKVASARVALVTETWYHRMGCRQFFVLKRDTDTNESIPPGRPQ